MSFIQFVNTNSDLAYFKKLTKQQSKSTVLNIQQHTNLFTSTKRHFWLKDLNKVSLKDTYADIPENACIKPTKTSNNKTSSTESTKQTHTLQEQASPIKWAQDSAQTIINLSIPPKKVPEEADPATLLDKSSFPTSLSSSFAKLKGKNSSTFSNVNYYLPLTDNFSPRMSAIFHSTMKKTSKSTASKAAQKSKPSSSDETDPILQEPCIDPPTPKRNGEWTEVLQPTRAKHQADTKPGDNYFPSSFPIKPQNNNSGNEPLESFTSGINIRIKLTPQTQIHSESLLQALLECFQLKDPWARITPKKQSSLENPFELWDKEQIQSTGPSITDYIESPLRKITKHEFTARVWMVTSIPLYQITQDDAVQQWLQTERVYLEKNNLTKVDLVNVGFLTKVNPRAESMSMTELRITELLGTESESFHLLKNTIFPAKSSAKSDHDIKTKVIMIRAVSKDAHDITEVLKKLSTETTPFYPWNEYQSLTEDQKRTIVLEQANFLKKFRTFTLDYFTPAVVDFTMEGHKISDIQPSKGRKQKSDNTTESTTTIKKFLQEHYKTGADETLFTQVLDPIHGKIEIIVDQENFVEAQACIRKLHQDLQFHCSPKGRELLFREILPEDTFTANFKEWQSFTLNKTVKATKKQIPPPHDSPEPRREPWIIGQTENQGKINTRNHGLMKTFREATIKLPGHDIKTMNSVPTSEVTFTTHAESTSVRALQQHVDDMQKSIQIMEQTITKQGQENKQDVIRLIADSETRQYAKIHTEIAFHTQTLMQQMHEITDLLHQNQKRPPTTPPKSRKYYPSKRVHRANSSPISIKYKSSDSDSDGNTVDSEPMLSD